MQYSPIKSFRLKNFRNLGDVTIDFTESPIIALKGDNEAGKTSVVLGAAVLGLNANYRDQKDYIMDGKAGFGLQMDLEDGTVIARVKTNSTNVYAIDRPDGSHWEIDKLENSDVPTEVQKVMGLIKEPETGEFLHIRTYEDRLLFIITPASTNYKVMYNALHVENLTKAISLGSTAVNELRSKFDLNNTKADTLVEEVKKIKIYDIEPIVNIKKRLEKEYATIQKLAKAVELLRRIQQIDKDLGILAEINRANLQPIDSVEARNLSIINTHIKRIYEINKLLKVYEKTESLETVDIAFVKRLKDISEKTRILRTLEFKIKNYEILEGLEGIDTEAVYKLQNILSKLNRLSKIDSRLRHINIDTLEEIDVSTELKLRDAINKVTKLREISSRIGNLDIENLKEIDTSTIYKLKEALDKASSIRIIQARIDKLDISNASKIDDNEIKSLEKMEKVIKFMNKARDISSQIDYMNAQIEEYRNKIKESGALVTQCPKCGETIIMDARVS